jgi:hypothetical protein
MIAIKKLFATIIEMGKVSFDFFYCRPIRSFTMRPLLQAVPPLASDMSRSINVSEVDKRALTIQLRT